MPKKNNQTKAIQLKQKAKNLGLNLRFFEKSNPSLKDLQLKKRFSLRSYNVRIQFSLRGIEEKLNQLNESLKEKIAFLNEARSVLENNEYNVLYFEGKTQIKFNAVYSHYMKAVYDLAQWQPDLQAHIQQYQAIKQLVDSMLRIKMPRDLNKKQEHKIRSQWGCLAFASEHNVNLLSEFIECADSALIQLSEDYQNLTEEGGCSIKQAINVACGQDQFLKDWLVQAKVLPPHGDLTGYTRLNEDAFTDLQESLPRTNPQAMDEDINGKTQSNRRPPAFALEEEMAKLELEFSA